MIYKYISPPSVGWLVVFGSVFVYLAAGGLSCGMQDLSLCTNSGCGAQASVIAVCGLGCSAACEI